MTSCHGDRLYIRDIWTALALVCWTMWSHQNDIVFNGAAPSLGVVLRTIREEAELWRTARLFRGCLLKAERWKFGEWYVLSCTCLSAWVRTQHLYASLRCNLDRLALLLRTLISFSGHILEKNLQFHFGSASWTHRNSTLHQ